MLKYIAFCCFFALQLHAQTAEEFSAVRAPIMQLFDGMRAADSSAVKAAFLPDAPMHTVAHGRTGQAQRQAGSLPGFLAAVAQSEPGALDERIQRYDIRIDGLLATAWTEYAFFRNGQLSHCGTNAFELFRTDGGWKIAAVTDTRYREGCTAEANADEASLHALLDGWHRAAAEAHADAFFGAMTDDAIYLGTDASERWLRDELREWAAFAFERETAWAFRPYQRQLYFSADGRTAWFEELLDTENMGTCRGSGVLSKNADGWAIRHYNLSLMVPNDDMEEVQQLLKRP